MGESELLLTRELDAPRELVWRVWTDAEPLARWWGPAGTALEVVSHRLLPGGEFRFGIPGQDGQTLWARLAYDRVEVPQTLEMRLGITDAQGALIPFPGLGAYPLEVRHTVTFFDLGGRTRVELRLEPLGDTAERAGFASLRDDMTRGYLASWDQMVAVAIGIAEEPRTLAYRRTFAAPLTLVWKAWTTAHRIAPWWGPAGFGNTVYEMDVRPGGVWRYTMHGPDGTDYENLITYRRVEEPRLLDYDHGEPGEPNQFHVTVTFSEAAGGTLIDYRMVFPTKAARDNAVEKYGAVEGFRQNMDRFDAWLKKTGLVVTRIFAAPRAQVWKAWIEPKLWHQRWGADGTTVFSGGQYLEIVPEEKLRYTDAFCAEKGADVAPAALGLPGERPSQVVAVTFENLGPQKTLVTVHQEPLPAEWVEVTWAGWATSFDKLDDALAFPPEVLAWEAAQTDALASVCRPLRRRVARALPGTEVRLYHGSPVWFHGGNPLCGYTILKDEVQLLFWSGQSFATGGLKATGKFQAAEVRLSSPDELASIPLDAWLGESRVRQWNYRDLPKNQGALVPLTEWEP